VLEIRRQSDQEYILFVGPHSDQQVTLNSHAYDHCHVAAVITAVCVKVCGAVAPSSIGRLEGPCMMQVGCHRVILQPSRSSLLAAEEEAGD